MIKLFRLVAFLEGVSYILLLFIAVPIKYLLNDPTYVKLLGMPHGILFVGYIIFSVIGKNKFKWSYVEFFIVFGASIIPFGTFYVDKKYLRSN
jgi:integral membrane protein